MIKELKFGRLSFSDGRDGDVAVEVESPYPKYQQDDHFYLKHDDAQALLLWLEDFLALTE